MSEHPQIPSQPVPGRRAAPRAAEASLPPVPHAEPPVSRGVAAGPDDSGDDPVTDWLLQRADLDADEFSVLFAIHKLRARRRHAGWIGRRDLCRSTSLDPAALGRVLATLRERGLVWMARHPTKTDCARYLLIVQ